MAKAAIFAVVAPPVRRRGPRALTRVRTRAGPDRRAEGALQRVPWRLRWEEERQGRGRASRACRCERVLGLLVLLWPFDTGFAALGYISGEARPTYTETPWPRCISSSAIGGSGGIRARGTPLQ